MACGCFLLYKRCVEALPCIQTENIFIMNVKLNDTSQKKYLQTTITIAGRFNASHFSSKNSCSENGIIETLRY